MAANKKIKLKWIKGLMLFSQVLLIVFTAQWLVSQYNEQQRQLKKNLTDLFTDVQNDISDSLIITNLVDTAHVNKADMAVVNDPSGPAATPAKRKKVSPETVRRMLHGLTPLTRSEQSKFFTLDTIVFNEMFANAMKMSGWDFKSQWVNNSDSEKEGKAIFIQSSFFTDANGVVVSNYNGYIWGRMVPQMIFVLVLLVLTAAAFLLAYNGLRKQIKLSELKDDFISNMSHELKTPIATVKVALEALNNYRIIDDPTLNKEYLGMATSEMDRLELLATRVLNTSLLESGKIYLQQESYDLRKLVDEVLQTMQLRIQQHGARVAFDVSGSSFLMRMDKLHMQGVLVNLVDNSLKYGIAPTDIHINLSENEGAIKLEFTDNGPGIPEEYKEKVFEKFFRVPTGNRHNAKGFGLGLSYAAQVMRQHNGSINVNNVAEGGCVFTLTF